MAITATKIVTERLRERAEEVPHPFYYSAYIKVEEDWDGDYRWPKCGNDAFMRDVDGVSCEYGTDWIMEHRNVTEGAEVTSKSFTAKS